MKSKEQNKMFFFQAEDGIRDHCVTGVQTCALRSTSPEQYSNGAWVLRNTLSHATLKASWNLALSAANSSTTSFVAGSPRSAQSPGNRITRRIFPCCRAFFKIPQGTLFHTFKDFMCVRPLRSFRQNNGLSLLQVS